MAQIYGPLVEECGLQVRMNVARRWVEMKVSKALPEQPGCVSE